MNTAIAKLPTYIQEKVANAQVPVKYTAAVKALIACRTIDEAKYFADKSDALAAWAKIYQHDEAAAEAKRLKLHAYRRMGILAVEIQPGRKIKGVYVAGGDPGPAALLRSAGLPGHDAQSAVALSRLNKKKFRNEVASARPHAPSFFRDVFYGYSSGWKILGSGGKGSMMAFRCFCRKQDPKEIAASLSPTEAKKAKEIATDIIEWMDAFDQYLPKV